jgi:hypothetical protein
MNLNQIQLSPQMLVELYPDVLVETEMPPSPEQPASKEIPPLSESKLDSTAPQSLKYLGNNQKRILILVAHESVPFLPDVELTFLANILSACKLSLADIAIVNYHNKDHGYLQQAISQLNPVQVLLFGIAPLSAGLPMNFPMFQLQPYDQRTYLYSPTLPELESDKVLKIKLWNCLKTLFEL